MTEDILKNVNDAKSKKEKLQRVAARTGLGAACVWLAGAFMSVSAVTTVGVVTLCAAQLAKEFFEQKGRRDVMLKQRNIAQQFGTPNDVDTINQALDSDAKQNALGNKMATATVLIASAIGLSPFLVASNPPSGVFVGTIIVGAFAGLRAARAIEKKEQSDIRFYGVQPIVAENVVSSILKERGIQEGGKIDLKPSRIKMK